MKDHRSFKAAFDDIPAIVGTGLSQMRRARYLLIQIDQAEVARAWLSQLLASDVVHSLARVRAQGEAKSRRKAQAPSPAEAGRERVNQCVTLAFSHAGLLALGLKEDPDYPFPSAFRAGMSSAMRRQLLADAPDPDWQWGDAGESGQFEAHILVVHYWSELDCPQPLPLLQPAQLPAGLRVLSVTSCPSYIAAPTTDPAVYEPFGFRDGIGQPVLDGMGLSRNEKAARKAAGALFQDRIIQPGEFVLGQYNEYGERAYCPNLQGWPQAASSTGGFGRNGTYLAVRQIAQDVPAFSQFVNQHAPLPLGDLFVGRRRPAGAERAAADGYSLLRVAQPPQDIDAFRYLENDINGFECPRGAHARRANPRDGLASGVEAGIASSKLHRILRRGRVYAAQCSEGGDIEACPGHAKGREGELPCGRGLMFVALNTDLERQFEFVQKSWIAGSRFGDMSDEQDPLLGTGDKRSFTVQGCPVGQRIRDVPRFTTVLGGGYFLAPSLSALRWLVAQA